MENFPQWKWSFIFTFYLIGYCRWKLSSGIFFLLLDLTFVRPKQKRKCNFRFLAGIEPVIPVQSSNQLHQNRRTVGSIPAPLDNFNIHLLYGFRVWMACSKHGFGPIRARVIYMLFYKH